MPLTPAEEQELLQLESEFAEKGPLSRAEEAELVQLEAEFGGTKQTPQSAYGDASRYVGGLLSSAQQAAEPILTHQAIRPILDIGPETIAEAKAGREQLKSGLGPITTELDDVPILGNTARGLVGMGRMAMGGLRSAFPLAGGIGKALAGNPVTNITGSELAGQIASAAFPLGVFGLSRVPTIAARIAKAHPLTQAGVVELGGDAPTIPSVANIASRPKDAATAPRVLQSRSGVVSAEDFPVPNIPEPAPEVSWVKSTRGANDDVVTLSTDEFDQAFSKDPGFYVGKHGAGSAIGGRYAGVQEFLKKGEPIEMPEVTVGNDGSVGFTNGRHRYAVMRDMGVPVKATMSSDSARNARKFGYAYGESPKSAPEQKAISFDDLLKDDYVAPGETRKKLVDIAQNKFGFKFTRAERSGSRFGQSLDTGSGNILGGGFQDVHDANRVKLSYHLSARVGNPVIEITPEWMADTFSAVGNKFDSIAAGSGIINTQDIVAKAKDLIPGPIDKAARAEFTDVLSILGKQYGEALQPDSYVSIRSQLTALARKTTDRDLARRYSQLIDILDESAQKTMLPTAADEFRVARQQYKDLLIIEESFDRGTGMVEPGKFATAVDRSYKRGRNRVPIGENDMIDLATIMRQFKNQIPSSGTAERSAGYETLKRIGGVGVAASVIDPTLVTLPLIARAYKKWALSGGPKAAQAGKPQPKPAPETYGTRKGERIYSVKDLERNPKIKERLKTSGYKTVKVKGDKIIDLE